MIPVMHEELDPELVLGVDNIVLDLPIAGLGSRALAVALDYLLVTAVTTMALVIVGIGLGAAGLDRSWLIAILVATPFFLSWAYFIGFEVARCRTIGKMAVRLRVIGRQGGTPSTGSLVIRNLLREVDLVFGAPLILLDARCRRLGDRAAGTLVVHESREPGSFTIGRLPATWGARETAVVEALLERASEMEPERCEALARRVVELLERDAPELLPPAARVNHPLVTLRQALHVRGAS